MTVDELGQPTWPASRSHGPFRGSPQRELVPDRRDDTSPRTATVHAPGTWRRRARAEHPDGLSVTTALAGTPAAPRAHHVTPLRHTRGSRRDVSRGNGLPHTSPQLGSRGPGARRRRPKRSAGHPRRPAVAGRSSRIFPTEPPDERPVGGPAANPVVPHGWLTPGGGPARARFLAGTRPAHRERRRPDHATRRRTSQTGNTAAHPDGGPPSRAMATPSGTPRGWSNWWWGTRGAGGTATGVTRRTRRARD